MSVSADMWTVEQALQHLPAECRYHGEDFGRLGYEFRSSLGVSAVVRLMRDASRIEAGEVGMIVGQAPNGRHRYSVMFPGYPFALSLAADDVELVQGLAPERVWWRPPSDVWAALRERVAHG